MTTNLKLNTANWFKKQLLLLGLFILAILPLVGHAQQYPVRIIPVITPPYSLKLADYAHAPESKLQLQVLMTDLQQPQHHTGIKFFLQAGLNAQPIAQSNEFIIGQKPFLLTPGANITLTSTQIKHLFDPQNLNGLNPQQYASPLPEGLYQFCFQAYDFYTKNNLSEKACASVFLNQYDPPQLNIPQNAEKIQAINPYGNGSGILFQWMPRQVAPNTKYNFILKEIWDTNQSPISAFLASPVLWKEETFAPNLYYSIDKTQLIPGRRYAWQVQAFSSNPFDNFNYPSNNQIQSANYKNNGLSEIFFFDYVENCQTPTFLMAKNKGRGRVEIHWNFLGNPNGLYKIQYRKKGANTPWMHTEAYQNSAFINGLEDLTEYEYRVGAVCGQTQTFSDEQSSDNAYAFSPVQFFTTDSQDVQNNNFQCGVMPAVDISNKEPLRQSLVANDIFTAGDFPVTIIDAQGSNGIFTGTGFIQVPYLADTKIKVAFQNITINSDKKLISGTVETEYDPEERNIMPLGDLLKDLGIIIAKENPTDEDKEKYKNLITQLDFYSSDIDDIEMSNEDKELFNRVIRNTRFASLELNEQQKENAIKAFEEGNKLYKKYEKEFNFSYSAKKIIDNFLIYHPDNEKIENAKSIIYFVNGHFSSILPGPSKGGIEYWKYFDDNKKNFIHNIDFTSFFNFNKNETAILYINGSSVIGFDKDFKDRFRLGQKFIKYFIKMNNFANKKIAIVAHSEGVAYASGVIESLYKNNIKVQEAIYLSGDECAEDGAFTNPNIPTYQIEYMYFDKSFPDGNCEEEYDWVIGTNHRYKTYSGLKGVTKFGIAIRNDLEWGTVHGTSATSDIIQYLKFLKEENNVDQKSEKLNTNKSYKPFWKINSQFINSNHPQFNKKTNKIDSSIPCIIK